MDVGLSLPRILAFLGLSKSSNEHQSAMTRVGRSEPRSVKSSRAGGGSSRGYRPVRVELRLRDAYGSEKLVRQIMYEGAWSVGPRPTAALVDSSFKHACASLGPGGGSAAHSNSSGHYRRPRLRWHVRHTDRPEARPRRTQAGATPGSRASSDRSSTSPHSRD